jgi:signal transduction histidine kinase
MTSRGFTHFNGCSGPLPPSRGSSKMGRVRLGRRLALLLLLTLTPVVAVYTYWSVQWSRRGYVTDLKRETRATMRGLAPVLAGYVNGGQWTQVEELFGRMGADGTAAALLNDDGDIRYASAGFPVDVFAAAKERGIAGGVIEFEHHSAGRYWFCRIIPIDTNPRAYFMVAQDWTDIGENLRQRMLPAIGAALLVIAVIGCAIPLLVSRYVSKPLAELSRKVVRFAEDQPERDDNDEVKLISEEFQRLDQQLTKAHTELLERHRYELELDRRLQRADRLATIGTLSSGLAHEIGNPMGIIRTRAELLLDARMPPEKTRESLEIVLKQIDRVSKIVRMLLDYARGRESRRVECDLRTVLGHVLKLVETEARRNRVKIVTEQAAEPLIAVCDPDQIQQVFVNLAVNAFDAMAPQGGSLRITSAIVRRERGGDILKVTFEDSGPGVPAELRTQLFDPFFTTKPPGKGTGMGLAVGQSIMRDHGGDLVYEPTAVGARFSAIIPMKQPGLELSVRLSAAEESGS